MMRYPSASSAIDTEVRMLLSSSTRAMVDIHWLLLIATIRLKKSPTHKLAEICRTVSEKRARPVGRGNSRILAAVYAPPWVNRVPYFGMIFSYPPHRGIGVGEWSDTRCGACRGNGRRRINANFWSCFEISGHETIHRLQRSGGARSAPAKFVAGSSGDLSITFLA